MAPLHHWRHSHEFRRCFTLRKIRFHKRHTVSEITPLWNVTSCGFWQTQTYPEKTVASHFTLKMHASQSFETVLRQFIPVVFWIIVNAIRPNRTIPFICHMINNMFRPIKPSSGCLDEWKGKWYTAVQDLDLKFHIYLLYNVNITQIALVKKFITKTLYEASSYVILYESVGYLVMAVKFRRNM